LEIDMEMRRLHKDQVTLQAISLIFPWSVARRLRLTLMIPNLFPSGRLMLFLWLDPFLAGSMPSSLPRIWPQGEEAPTKLLKGIKVCVL